MSADRPAARFWAKAEAERRALLAASAARFSRQMLEAGGIEATDLSREARRTLAWLAEGDTPTVAGVAELLRAARAAGQREANLQHRTEATSRPDSDARVAAVQARLAGLSRGDDQAVGL